RYSSLTFRSSPGGGGSGTGRTKLRIMAMPIRMISRAMTTAMAARSKNGMVRPAYGRSRPPPGSREDRAAPPHSQAVPAGSPRPSLAEHWTRTKLWSPGTPLGPADELGTLAPVLLAYVDESYDRGFYFTTAVILRQGAVAPLTGTLDDLAQRAEAQFPDQLDG